MTVRTRFAPSPTGNLHIGSARTALFAWLYAKRHGGTFILRIEDTDRERSTPGAVDVILKGMAWLGLDADEGPFYQTQRMDRYTEVLDTWLAEGKAYRCTCSKERLDTLRQEQMANQQKPRYDGHCRDKSLSSDIDEPFVIRFKTPTEGEIRFEDAVHGAMCIQNSELDDVIIARSDGSPTYNFTVIVDDADMGITHVIRGDDHLNNTPRQIHMLQALDANIPVYAHVPMILGSDGKKLSKRHGAKSVLEYKDAGYLPHALLNYLVRLGWSHGDQEIFSSDEMVAAFDIHRINKAAAAFNPEKLVWVNQHYLKTDAIAAIAEQLGQQLQTMHVDITTGPRLEDVTLAQRERCETLLDMAQKSVFFYAEPDYDKAACAKHLTDDAKAVLEALFSEFNALEQWEKEAIHAIVKTVAERLELKMGKVAQPLRVALTGNTISPSIDITVHLMGKERCLQRLQALIKA